MSESLLPTWIIPEQETHESLDEGSSVFAAAFAPGLAQRQSYGGLRLKLSRRHTVRGEEKAQLLSILNATRGRYNVLRTKVHFALRGSGFGGELLTNNTFANGTTGWGAAAGGSIAVHDRILRHTITAVTGAANPSVQQTSVSGLVQYAPYVARAHILRTRSAGTFTAGAFINTGIAPATAFSYVEEGLATASAVSIAGGSANGFYVLTPQILGFRAGDFVDVSYTSFSLCPLVDNSPNGFLQSDSFGNAAWTKNAGSVSGDSRTAPDGSGNGDDFIENSANAEHYIEQNYVAASAAADFCAVVDLKANGRGFAIVRLIEATGSTSALFYANLITGARTNESVGANWSNIRTFTRDIGNNWFRFFIVARKTNAATTLTLRVTSTDSAGGSSTQVGLNASAFFLWRGGIAPSSVPFEPAQTTASASTGTAQTGNALNLKGLPASTNGLLLPGDAFEINGEIKFTTAALNSDAAGLGYLQFEPALVRSPADNDPIIVTDPMGKFLVSNIKIDNEFGTQARVSYDLEHIYE